MLLATLATLWSGAAFAAPGVLPIQGYLTDSAGVAVDGPISVDFRLYPDSASGTAFFTQTVTLDVEQGRFSARLGAGGTELELDAFALHPEATLTLQIAGDTESGRVPLDTVPYAAVAREALTLEGQSIDEILLQIPTDTAIDARAAAVCYDTVDELTTVLDASYLPASYAPGEGELTTVLDAVYLPVSYQPSWDDLTDLPPGFADDVDDDTLPTGGLGVVVDGSEVAIDPWAFGPQIPNARFEAGDLTGWVVDTGGGTVVAVPGGFAFRNNTNSEAWVSSTTRVPVDALRNYRVSGTFRRTDAVVTNGCIYLGVRAFDAAGANIPGPTGGAWWAYPLECAEFPANDPTWRTYTYDLGADFASALPPAARTVTVGAILNYNYGAGNGRTYEVTNLQLRAIDGPRRVPVSAPALLNSWANAGAGNSGAGYYRDASGVVHLRGYITGGTYGQAAFVLPYGYRPIARSQFGTTSNLAFGRVDVLADGTVQPMVGDAQGISLDGVSFLAER